ncbi:MAG TPA: tannase/feruloyl esterase family alpha/beta hydrolase [Cyclobacteriaceae bacterium]|nr:tannase/feruloyl esterase family alpha/beta hydrolase [Cyclobacteriaceae bacterium]
MKGCAIICLFLWLSFPILVEAQAPCIPCEKLKDLKLPEVTILSVESRVSDTLRHDEPWLPPSIITKPFCRVMGRISAEINFELLLPQQWNGRFLMSGGGGFVGSIQNSFKDRLNEGYASAGTDTGHQGSGVSAEWAYDNMERQINFGRLAIHRTTVISKAIIEAFYCSAPAYSYFLGCSRGGGQAMMEAQVYPQDFNGIVAGAPAFSWPATGAKFINVNQKNYPDPKNLKPVLTSDNLKLLQDYVLKQCDNLDGLSDKIINDPRDCKIDLSKLPLCPGNQSSPTCFTKEQVEVIRAVYEPLEVDQKTIYPAFPFGEEADQGSWDVWIAGTTPYQQPSLHYLFGINMFKYLVFNDSSWDYTKYNFKNFFEQTRYAAAFLDATQTDYSEFKKNNAKMIMYHGWNDPALSAYSTIDHYEAAMQRDRDIQSYIRLFLLPGVLHCGGGTGCDNVDWVGLIRDWVENNKAPERIISSKITQGKTVATKPIYPYPKITVYGGSGDPSQEKSYKVKN